MKGNVKIFFLSVINLLLISSCDWKANVAIIKNNTKSEIIVAFQPDEVMADSILYNFYFPKVLVRPGNSEPINIPNRVPTQATDSEKVYLYILNKDSLFKYQKLKKIQGLVKKSVVKKIEIQLNQIKDPLDTIYINTLNH